MWSPDVNDERLVEETVVEGRRTQPSNTSLRQVLKNKGPSRSKLDDEKRNSGKYAMSVDEERELERKRRDKPLPVKRRNDSTWELFVRNFPTDTTEDDLHDVFRDFNCLKTRLKRPPEKNPYAFVRFAEYEQAVDAFINTDGKEFRGRKLIIAFSRQSVVTDEFFSNEQRREQQQRERHVSVHHSDSTTVPPPADTRSDRPWARYQTRDDDSSENTEDDDVGPSSSSVSTSHANYSAANTKSSTASSRVEDGKLDPTPVKSTDNDAPSRTFSDSTSTTFDRPSPAAEATRKHWSQSRQSQDESDAAINESNDLYSDLSPREAVRRIWCDRMKQTPQPCAAACDTQKAAIDSMQKSETLSLQNARQSIGVAVKTKSADERLSERQRIQKTSSGFTPKICRTEFEHERDKQRQHVVDSPASYRETSVATLRKQTAEKKSAVQQQVAADDRSRDAGNEICGAERPAMQARSVTSDRSVCALPAETEPERPTICTNTSSLLSVPLSLSQSAEQDYGNRQTGGNAVDLGLKGSVKSEVNQNHSVSSRSTPQVWIQVYSRCNSADIGRKIQRLPILNDEVTGSGTKASSGNDAAVASSSTHSSEQPKPLSVTYSNSHCDIKPCSNFEADKNSCDSFGGLNIGDHCAGGNSGSVPETSGTSSVGRCSPSQSAIAEAVGDEIRSERDARSRLSAKKQNRTDRVRPLPSDMEEDYLEKVYKATCPLTEHDIRSLVSFPESDEVDLDIIVTYVADDRHFWGHVINPGRCAESVKRWQDTMIQLNKSCSADLMNDVDSRAGYEDGDCGEICSVSTLSF